MSHKTVLGIVFVASLLIATWVFAQARITAKPESTEVGRFAVSGSDPTVLVDTITGKTWISIRPLNGERVWLPATRIDDPEEALVWRKEEDARRAQAEAEREKQRQQKPKL